MGTKENTITKRRTNTILGKAKGKLSYTYHYKFNIFIICWFRNVTKEQNNPNSKQGSIWNQNIEEEILNNQKPIEQKTEVKPSKTSRPAKEESKLSHKSKSNKNTQSKFAMAS